ncbi:ABC-type sugar transport system, periplasmic component [Thermobacillus composti KWC4]|uniref:ABC-type sugar transport system, periplasmic component n=1 Tax=Thermobacillus composti (strain DSM 18247 / JCM 13945 / KWC4) TaxID=717605 RepID=L0EDG4_THECK|nr:sugar ABC transporter substrate-binding protein [Thermobacillus composti]AGA57669.1 ABC-type sugar transport system, periplasmic component [Thermobacillus composti KWC4]
MKGWIRRTRPVWLATMAMALALAGCGGGDAKTGGTGGSSQGGQGEKVKIKWATWGNPGELTRFQEFTKEFNAKHPNIEAELIPIPGEYEQKILTQLSGGTAPDAFYAGDGTIVKLIENGTIEELTPYLKQSDSKIKETDFFEGLWGAARKDGKIYGLTVDCNPMVFWYNKKVLKDAGVTEMPADLYEKGQWNWETFKSMVEKVRATGKYGYILGNWWGPYYSWITSNGGKIYDDANGEFIAHKDGKAAEAFKFLYDNVQAKNFTFAGTLPKGQGADAMFMSNQVAFVTAGRWYLPIFKQNQSLEFDIVPWPTNTGKKLEPAGIPTAYIVMNKNTKHKNETWQFISEFVSKEGQLFRLKGGGNAVPSIAGVDEVVLEGNIPEHAKYFLETRQVGYALTPHEAGVPGLSKVITDELEAFWLKGGNPDSILQTLGEKANKKIAEYKAGK